MLSEPAWLEIRGVRHPANDDHQGWLDGAGYYSSRDAYIAGIVGIVRYPDEPPPDYEDPSLVGSIHGKYYSASNWLLDKLIGLKEILETIQGEEDEEDEEII
jgi:hypothetical protein